MKTKLADLEKQLADSKTEVEAQKELTAQVSNLEYLSNLPRKLLQKIPFVLQLKKSLSMV